MKRTVAAVVLGIAMLLVVSAPASSQTQEQKRKWRQQVIKTLQNTATAEESYWSSHNQTYTTSLSELKKEGLVIPRKVTIEVVLADESKYCINGDHDRLKQHWYYHSNEGRWSKGRC